MNHPVAKLMNITFIFTLVGVTWCMMKASKGLYIACEWLHDNMTTG